MRVSYGTVRLANDVLCRNGVINRHHGRGTYVALSTRKSSRKQHHHRLGLLYVDLAQPLHPYSQQLTFAIQRTALKAGYELIIEEMRTEELLQGKLPEMIRRRSVDALLLDGRVRDHHIRFLEDHSFLYLILGNCPLGTDVPQVRINVEGLGYEITRELLRAGRRPVWFDADPSKADLWYVDLERFRGYANAVKTQIWIAICVYVLVAILRKELGLTQSLHSILQVLSANCFEKVPLVQLLPETAHQDRTGTSHNQLMLFEL